MTHLRSGRRVGYVDRRRQQRPLGAGEFERRACAACRRDYTSARPPPDPRIPVCDECYQLVELITAAYDQGRFTDDVQAVAKLKRGLLELGWQPPSRGAHPSELPVIGLPRP